MQSQSQPVQPGQRTDFEALCRRALLLDLELSPRGKILKIGAVLADRTFARSGNFSLEFALDELAGLAGAATCVLGHNLVRHDLRQLAQIAPGHPLLRLPVVDTLVLSPIAFPENPYHRLVKDYKLVKESVNDPIADAVQAAALFGDQFRSLAGLRQTEPALFELLHFLLATPCGGKHPCLPVNAASLPRVQGTQGSFENVETCPDPQGGAASPRQPPGSANLPCHRHPELAAGSRLDRHAGSVPPQAASGRAETDAAGLASPPCEVKPDSSALAQGLDLVFRTLGSTCPEPARALELCRILFRRWGCASMPVESSLFEAVSARLALAYTVAWLRVAGANSVLPPWVRKEHPLTSQWIKRLRETPCQSKECAYCQRTHNAQEQLRAFFGFDDFRPVPANRTGGSLQQDIVEAGMRDESLLAILPTGGGKSLCYQLPALVRNYRRGVLTIVISPLQALMKDQVDGLVRRTGTPFAAALYGLLTPPERSDVLRRVRLGDVALLYVSPEQLRNRSFRDAIAQREVGCWVVDEAHCLSKWGHDFRPDYLYAGRFIREFSKAQGSGMPPIACFTATAKRDVKEEIVAYFKTETGCDLALYEGGVERDNLRFEVLNGF